MELSPRRRRTLEAICDTLLPRLDGLPSATELGVPDEILAALNTKAEERDLGGVLALFRLTRFESRSQEARERALLGWAESRLWQRRAAFQGLRKGTLVHAAMLSKPLWELLGYLGPLGAVPGGARTIEPLRVERGTTLDCDVCVIGSGAGGGVAAGVLAAAGLDVVVLEAGAYFDDDDFDGAELTGYRRLYLGGGNLATHDRSVELLAGSCLGGGTVVNYTTSFRTPDDVRAEWGSPFDSDEFTRSLDAVCKRSHVNTDHNLPSTRDAAMARGLEALGWQVDAMPRNVVGCDQDGVCGYCGFGCRLGAKQSTAKTWLRDAHERGARILVETPARRVLVEGGRAAGVECDGVTVRARAVVVAAGALHTPAVLKRSGLGNENVGRHLRLHPATAMIGVFDEELRPWEGTVQALYSDEHARLEDGFGFRFETAPVHPSLLAAFAPWRGSRDWLGRARLLPRSSPIGILLRDRGSGEVRVDRNDDLDVRYRLSDFDARHVRRGVEAAARALEEAGAREVLAPCVSGVRYEVGRAGAREEFMRGVDANGFGAGRWVFYSFHIMGSARIGRSAGESACNEDGELWGTRNLVVADGSTFPTASGVNPMISIEAIAHLVASRLAARMI